MMDERQHTAVQALLRSDVATSNIELVEYLISALKIPAPQAWAAVRNRNAQRASAAAR